MLKNYRMNVVEFPKEAPKIVLLHGLGGTHRYWLTGLAQLKANYHVILIDLLGFGDSEKPWINYTKSRHLDALESCLAEYDQFFLIGHSLGAGLSIAYSARNPDKCLGQVLISLPFFPSEQQAFSWLRKTPSGWLMTNMLTVIVTCIITRRVLGPFLPKILKEFPREVAEDLVKHTFLSSTTSLWQILYRSIISKDTALATNKIPTLCIHALNDNTAPIDTVKNLVAQQSNWTLDILKTSSHHPWLWDNAACQKPINRAIGLWQECQ